MANQPKKYKKFVATAATATLVASAIVPVASAATPSFSDIKGNDHEAAIKAVAELGYINGYQDGTFKPGKAVTRGQVALILGKWAQAQGVEVPADYATKAYFNDLPASATDENKQMYALVKAAGIFEGSNGSLNPGQEISRQHMAVVLNGAFKAITGKSLVETAGDTSDVTVGDLNKVAADYQDEVKALKALGITAPANFNPTGKVTRGQFASFLNATIAVQNGENLVGIKSVTALDDSNRFIEIVFNKDVKGLEASDITITNAKTQARHGVKEVKVSSDGRTATVELYAPEDSGVLEYLTDYNVKVTVGGETLTYTFNRPAHTEARVVDINVQDNEIVVYDDTTGAKNVIKIAKDTKFDYEAAFGEVVNVWYNADKELVKYTLNASTTKYDAIEITKADEIKLVTEDVKYDVSDDQYRNTTKDKFKFYLNGQEVEIGDEVKVGDKFNFAKVGYDKSGDIEYVAAYNLSKFLVVDKVVNKEVVGIKGNGTGGSFDADKATIIKDGKVISLSDLKQGDVLFFYENSTDKKQRFAEVFSGETVTGEITTIFNDSIRVNNETYKFSYNSDALEYKINYGAAVYLDEDGETAILDADAAEELQAAGPVTLHLDRAGNLVYVEGDLADVASNSKVAILTEAIKKGQSNFGDALVQLESLNQDNEKKLYDLRLKELDAIIVDGEKYQIDNNSASKWSVGFDTTAAGADVIKLTKTGNTPVEIPLLAAGQLVELHLSDNGSVEELEFFNSKVDGTLNKQLEAGDKYADGVKLNSNTPLFIATNNTDKYDAKNIKVTTWGEYTGSDINAAHFVYDKDGEVVGLVATGTATNSKVFEEAVITKVLRNKDGEIVEITAYINGEEKTVAVDEVNVVLAKGDATVLEFDKANDKLVTDIENSTSDDKAQYTGRVSSGWTVDNVDAGTGKVTLKKAGSADRTVTLANQGLVIDGNDSDLATKTLTDLRGKTNVTIVTDEAGSDFVKFFVYGAQAVTTPADTTAPVASVSALANATTNDADSLVVTFNEALFVKAGTSSVALSNGDLVTAYFTANDIDESGAFTVASATYNADNKTVTFAITGTPTANDTITVKTADTIEDAAGNDFAKSFEFNGTNWIVK